MQKIFSPENLSRVSARWPKWTLLLWGSAFIGAIALVVFQFSAVTTTEFKFLNEPDSERANALLTERLQGLTDFNEVVIVKSPTLTVDMPQFQDYVDGLQAEILGLGGSVIAGTSNFYDTGNETLVSDDRHTILMPIAMAGEFKDAEANAPRVRDILDSSPGGADFEVYLTGEATFSRDYTEFTQKDLLKGEALAIPIAMVILVIVFGALAAALLPMIIAIASIVISLGIVMIVGQGFEFHVFVQNMITMIGLAVGIDYSVFILSRYREERARGLQKIAAIVAAGSTASRAVLFSGLTVVLALVGLLIVPHSLWISLGVGAILVVVVAVMASLTLLPAMLSLMGDGVDKLRIPMIGRRRTDGEPGRSGLWDRVSAAVMRRPLVSLLVTGSLLMMAALPLFDMNTGNFGVSTFPDESRAKEGYSVLIREFGFGVNDPVEIVIDGDATSSEVQRAIQDVRTALATDAAFGPSDLVVDDSGRLALVSVPLVGDATGEEAAVKAVRTVRRDYVPNAFDGVAAEVFVTGTTAEQVDFVDLSEEYRPLIMFVVLGLSFVLLTLVFRSLVIALKAIVMNLLSVGAAYGLLVLVFQKGIGNEIFGFPQVEVIQAWIPLMLFAVLFGLSMDYQVFLLSRIRERYLETLDNTVAVISGLRSTGKLITGAALIMVAVFGGFATGDLVAFQQFGFAMAVAILLDATVVRTVLVPATMNLLGDANWKLPKVLRWLPEIQVESAQRPRPTPNRPVLDVE